MVVEVIDWQPLFMHPTYTLFRHVGRHSSFANDRRIVMLGKELAKGIHAGEVGEAGSGEVETAGRDRGGRVRS